MAAGRKVRLSAHHRLGVPVHERAKDHGPLRRVPDGTEVTLLAELEGGWLRIALADGSQGFVTQRYLAAPSAPPARTRAAEPRVIDPRDATCAVARARAATRAKDGAARVATFNVRWFPDGQPGKKAPAGGGTDLGFLACTIASTGAEVVLVQEFKTGARAEASLRAVLKELDALTQGAWQARFDECPIETAQHVGVLFDHKRAQALGEARTLAEWNPLGGKCTGSLRPGLAQRFRLSSGVTAEVVSVHLKSGDDARSYGLRQDSLAALGKLPSSPEVLRIVGGDLNTMGCSDCASPVAEQAERAHFARAGTAAGLVLVEPAGGCSHYYRRHAGLLDGFWVGRAGSVRPGPGQLGLRVDTAGSCADLKCVALAPNDPLGALERVSDHCPLVLSVGAP